MQAYVNPPDDPREWHLGVIARGLGCAEQDGFCDLLSRIEKRGYRPFALHDGKKTRVIHSPRMWLKELQRDLYDRFILTLPVSPHVFNRPGRGVVKSAEQHVGNSHMIVLDVADCFPSTKMRVIEAAFAGEGIPLDAAKALTRLVSYDGELPHGPPTSPGVLDLVFKRIDAELQRLAQSRGATFTRYMDDLAFSGNRSLASLGKDATKILKKFGYRTRASKLRVWGPSEPHTVMSVVVSTTLNATPEFVAELAKYLRQVEVGNCRLSESQLLGKVDWIKSLNRSLGIDLERTLGKALKRRYVG